MDAGIAVSPVVVDFGDFVYGSGQRIRRALTVSNTTDSARSVTFSPDASLRHSALSFVIEKVEEAGGGGGHGDVAESISATEVSESTDESDAFAERYSSSFTSESREHLGTAVSPESVDGQSDLSRGDHLLLVGSNSNRAALSATGQIEVGGCDSSSSKLTITLGAYSSERLTLWFTPACEPPLPHRASWRGLEMRCSERRRGSVLGDVGEKGAGIDVSGTESGHNFPIDFDDGDIAPEDDSRYHLIDIGASLCLHVSRAGTVLAQPVNEGELSGAVRISGRGCVSHLYTNMKELLFDRCSPGKRYVKNFAVWNASEVNTHFHISLDGDPTNGDLDFLDYETGDSIRNARLLLEPLASYSVQVAFTAASVGSDGVSSKGVSEKSSFWLAVENLVDPRNVSYMRGATCVVAEDVGVGLEFSCDKSVRFGDCYAWTRIYQDIKVHNTRQEAVTVSLLSSVPDEISFELLTGEEGNQHGDPDLSVPFPDGDEGIGPIGTVGDGEDSLSGVPGLKSSEAWPPPSHAAGMLRPSLPTSAPPVLNSSSSGRSSRPRSGGSSGGLGPASNVRNQQIGFLATERLELGPDDTQRLRICYVPDGRAVASEATDPARLSLRKFQIWFRGDSGETHVLTGESRVCESIVSVAVVDMNLGDCEVLHRCDASVTLFNLADLPANVSVQCDSKCITLGSYSFTIEARESFDLPVQFLPRTLNPAYKKQIVIVNCCNPRSGRTTLDVRANIVDSKSVSLHAVFYKVLDPVLTNEVNFGRTAANYPALRAFRIQNVSSERLLLGFDRSEGLATFVPAWNTHPFVDQVVPDVQTAITPVVSSGASIASQGKQEGVDIFPLTPAPAAVSRTLQSLIDAEMLAAIGDEETRSRGNVAGSRVSPSSRRKVPIVFDATKFAEFVSQCPVSPVASCGTDHGFTAGGLNAEEQQEHIRQWIDRDFLPLSLQANVLAGMVEEMRWAEEQLRPGKALVDAVQNRTLVRSDKLMLRLNEESVICVSLTPDDRAVRRRATEISLKVQLLEFDSNRLEQRAKAYAWRGAMFSEFSLEDPPPREIVLSVQACKCRVKIRPLQILNFGTIEVGMQKHKFFVIDNSDSNACLVFAIQKTRSVASGDIRLGNGYDAGRLGVVRPFSVATIPFVFRPSLPGTFREGLQIINVMDPSETETLTVKAQVLKRSNFHVVLQSPTDFGFIECGEESEHVLKLDVHNDTEKVRKFCISVVDRRRSTSSVPLPKVLIVANHRMNCAESTLAGTESPELAAKKAKLEHYMKKGKAAKAEALRREIDTMLAAAASRKEAEEGEMIASVGTRDLTPASNRSSRAQPRTSYENLCCFSVSQTSHISVEVTLLIPKGHTRTQMLSPSVWGDSSLYSHARSRSLRDSMDSSFSSERLDRLGQGLPIAGRFSFTLGVYESKNKDACHTINCTTLVSSLGPLSDGISALGDISTAGHVRQKGDLVPGYSAGPQKTSDTGGPQSPTAGGRFVSSPLVEHVKVSADGTQAMIGSEGSLLPSLVAPRVELGNLQVGVAVRRPLQIRNRSSLHVEYDVLLPDSSDSDMTSLRTIVEPSSICRNPRCVVEVSALDCPIPPGHMHTFFVSLIPLDAGAHNRTVILHPRNVGGIESHRVELFGVAVRGESVRVVDPIMERLEIGGLNDYESSQLLPEGGGQTGPVTPLRLGFGVVDPGTEYALVRKLCALSLVDVDLRISARSNLSNQVFVFATDNLTQPVENISLGARGSVALWIAVAPRLRDEEVREGALRTIVGGLLITSLYGANVKMPDCTVRFSAAVGASHIGVSPAFLDLGSTLLLPISGVGGLKGSFYVKNDSVGVKAKYSLESGSPNITVESAVGGELAPREEGKESSLAKVSIKVVSKYPGLVDSHVLVRNVLSPTFSRKCRVRAYYDPGLVEASLDGHRRFESVEANVYLSYDGSKWNISRQRRHVLSLTAVVSRFSKAALVVPKSNLCVHLLSPDLGPVSEPPSASPDWTLRVSNSGLGGMDTDYVQCGAEFEFGGTASPRKDIYVCPAPPMALTAGEERALKNGEKLHREGGILLVLGQEVRLGDRVTENSGDAEESRSGEISFQTMTLSYCVSRMGFGTSRHGSKSPIPTGGQAELQGIPVQQEGTARRSLQSASPSQSVRPIYESTFSTDVGNFGHCNAWKDETAIASVCNPTDAPLEFTVDPLPVGCELVQVGCVSIAPISPGQNSARGHSGPDWYHLSPGDAVDVEVKILPRQLHASGNVDGQGLVCSKLVFCNRMNPTGGLIWVIRGRLTQPRLRFDGPSLTGVGESRVISIPRMYVPGTRSSSEPFKMKNVSDVRVSVGAEFSGAEFGSSRSEAAVALSKLLDVALSEHVSGVDFSQATLNPGESIDVRATAIACGQEDEASLLSVAFAESDSVHHVLGFARFGCHVNETVEPVESIQLRVICKRGEKLWVVPKELSFNGFMSPDYMDKYDIDAMLTTGAASSLCDQTNRGSSEANAQILKISNKLGRTDLRVCLKAADLPSGVAPVVVPDTALVTAGTTLDVLIGFLKNPSDRTEAYGTASILVYDVSSVAVEDAFSPRSLMSPVATAVIHIQPSSTGDEDNSIANSSIHSEGRGHRFASLGSARTGAGPMPVSGAPQRLSRPETSTSSAKSERSTSLSPPVTLTRVHLGLDDSSDVQQGSSGTEDPVAPLELPASRFFFADASQRFSSISTSAQGTGAFLASLQKPCRVEDAGASVGSRGSGGSSSLYGGGLFTLKGCSQIQGDSSRFELNCGQLAPCEDAYVRRLTLENRSADALEYRCVCIRSQSSSSSEFGENQSLDNDGWLSISRSGGVLSPAGDRGDTQSLVLSMERCTVSVYSAYLVVEAGTGDECDVKTVRLGMEVVADGASDGTAEDYFSVICDGRGADTRFIDYSDVMFGQLYRHRSFVVRNHSDVTLEFMLSSDLPGEAKSELSFSLTNAVLRKTSRVIVAPRQTGRVFLLYRPLLEDGESADMDDEIDRVFNVRVTCRLVKDYQGNIRILSRCRGASLAVRRTEFLFDCAEMVSSAVKSSFDQKPASPNFSPPAGLNFDPPSRVPPSGERTDDTVPYPQIIPGKVDLEIWNVKPHIPLTFCIKNKTRFFEVDCPKDVTVDTGSIESAVQSITIRPNGANIRERALYLFREKYVEEHISVYNRNYPREFFWVHLRLAIGGAASEFVSVTHKRAFAFSTLEGTIAKFLSMFAAFWAQFRRSDFCGAQTSVSALETGGLEDSGSGGAMGDTDLDPRAGTAWKKNHARIDLETWADNVATAPRKAGYDEVLFELHYATDELVHYMLKSASQTGLQMASMLYSYVFKHDVFATFLEPEGLQLPVPSMMTCWVGQLGHFLSFFPDKRHAFRSITELEDRLRARIVSSRPSTGRVGPGSGPQ